MGSWFMLIYVCLLFDQTQRVFAFDISQEHLGNWSLVAKQNMTHTFANVYQRRMQTDWMVLIDK